MGVAVIECYLMFKGSIAGDSDGNQLSEQYAHGGHQSVLQRDADLLHLQTEFERAAPGPAKVSALAAFNAEKNKRAGVDKAIRDAVRDFLSQPEFLILVQVAPFYSIPIQSPLHSPYPRLTLFPSASLTP